MKNNKGFTLIELMFVVAISAILMTIGIPMYSSYTLKSHRSEATSAILAASANQESWDFKNNEYAININDIASQDLKYYDLSLSNVNNENDSYTITATAKGDQAEDTGCTTISLQVEGAIQYKLPLKCWS